ncbi:MAG: SpoIIE family protein phosphatase [Bacteroidales bacterium]|nr:SpoIIE family protein phosphatase [Bacteroidales bacterium]
MTMQHRHIYAKRVIHTWIVAILMVCTLNVDAQTRPNTTKWAKNITLNSLEIFNYGTYGTDEGLASNNIITILRDSTGLMWIATSDGVNTFDGYEFSSYIAEKNDSLFSVGKRVKGICELPNNNILIAYADCGVSRFDRRSNTFSQNNSIFDIDRAYGIAYQDGFEIVASQEHVIIYDKEHDRKTKIDAPPTVPEETTLDRIRIEHIADTHNLFAMLFSTRSLGILDIYTKTIKQISFSNLDILDICADNDGSLFLATNNGVYNYSHKSKTITQIPILCGSVVQAFARDDSDGYWIAYDNNQIAKWDPARKTFTNLKNCEQFLNEQSRVNDIMEDHNGVLWVSTSNLGVIKLDTKRPKIRCLEIASDELHGSYITYQISAQSRREVWAAVGRYGVLKIDTKGKTSQLINVDGRHVYSILARKNNDIYFGTSDGLYKYNGDTNKPIHIHISDDPDLCNSLKVNYMIEDCLNNLWICTQKGLYKYNGKESIKLRIDEKDEHINTTFEDSDGRIWVGTESGAYYLDPGDTAFNKVSLGIDKGRIYNNTFCFSEYHNFVLIGTSAGLIVYEKETGKTHEASINAAFRNSKIFDVFTDRNGITWLSTNSGIVYVSSEHNQIYKFNHIDGLKYEGNECRKFTFCKGILYFGHAKKLNYIDTHKVRFSMRTPKTLISSITYGVNEEEKSIMMDSDTSFVTKYQSRAMLKINVASSDFSAPHRNLYQYKIDDGKWIQLPETSNTIILSGLQPNTYNIQVKSSNSDKIWSESPKSFTITILPPLWRSAMAIIFYIFVAIMLAWLVIEIRFRDLRKKMTIMENEARAKKTVEAQRNRLVKIHKDLTDSINYAKRIQESIMPREDQVVGLFAKLFVLYKPKDIVSGDFYCFYHRDNKTFIISADCTGHGVPGAFLSILGIDHLSNIITKQKEDDAGRILTMLHQDMHAIVFKENLETKDFNEGMDMTICVVDHEHHKINFAGAMNDLYMIRNNEIIVYHGDRHSLGANTAIENEDLHEYLSQDIDFQKGDIFYMFSDGYIDQFGGQEQKKFKTRRFKHLLMNIHKLPAKDQKIILNQKHNEWRGNIEQTDDVSVIGFEPLS